MALYLKVSFSFKLHDWCSGASRIALNEPSPGLSSSLIETPWRSLAVAQRHILEVWLAREPQKSSDIGKRIARVY